MIVRWLSDALSDLRAIRAYIAEHNPEAAQRVVAYIRRETLILSEQPDIGRIGRIHGTRELVIQPYPYIVAYCRKGSEIHILAVVHASRRWPEQM